MILTFVVKEHCGFNRVYYSLAHPVMLFIHKILFKEVERGLLESLSYYWILHVLKISMLKVKQTQFGSVLVYILVFVTTSIFSALIFINLGAPTLFAYLIAVTFFSNLVYLIIKKIQFIQFFFNWWYRLIK